MAERLYELVREEAALTGGETVYDLYCGIGTIGLSLARDALTVWGIEISEESVACAIENAELNAIGNVAFFAGNVGEVLRELRERAGDAGRRRRRPAAGRPRGRGLRRLGELGGAAPRLRLVQPDDARRRCEAPDRGVRLPRSLRTRPLDMFPHTPHVESVSLFERQPSGRLERGLTPHRSEPPPDQVGVREQEAERDRRQRGQPARRSRPSSGRSSARARPPSRARSRRGRSPKRTLAPRKSAKNMTSGRPRRAAPPPGHDEGDRERR